MTADLYDEVSETALIGGLMYTSTGFDDAVGRLQPGDFNGWRARMFDAILAAHRAGDRLDDGKVMLTYAHEHGVTTDEFISAQAAGSIGGTRRLTDRIVNLAVSRKVLGGALELADLARTGKVDASELVMAARDMAADLDAPPTAGAAIDQLSTVDDFLATADTTPTPWVIPGLLRSGWRCMVIGLEGSGKSVLARQVAIAAAQGVHPFFATRQIDPVRTLIVDLENPDDAIAETCRPISARAQQASTRYDQGRAWIYRRPEGMDLRKRSDRAALERVLSACRPDLVCMGPVYKSYRQGKGESDEQAVTDLQAVLDDFRTRFEFALLLEHHAPKATGLSGKRELVPHGTALWLRWPELGLKLIPCEDDGPAGSMFIGKFRFDRMKNSWPDRIDRGGAHGWPWQGYWKNGLEEF